MSKKVKKEYSFIVNGKKYKSLKEVPEKERKLLDKDYNGVADLLEYEQIEGRQTAVLLNYKKHKKSFTKEEHASKLLSLLKTVLIVAIVVGVAVFLTEKFINWMIYK